MKCHRGCDTRDILAAAGMSERDLFLNRGTGGNASGKVVQLPKRISKSAIPNADTEKAIDEARAGWNDYRASEAAEACAAQTWDVTALDTLYRSGDVAGPSPRKGSEWEGRLRLAYRNTDGAPTGFADRATLSRHTDTAEPMKVWAKGSRNLWPRVESIPDGSPLAVIVEGEADALALWSVGIYAVGIPGAKGWRSEYAERFARFDRVLIVADSDEDGRHVAATVAQDLADHGISARVGDLYPDRTDGSDVRDLIRSGVKVSSVVDLEKLLTMTPEPFRPGLRLQRLSDIGEPLPVEWLEGDIAEGRMPRGEFAILFGEPGVGKGSITAQIVAEVTKAGRAVIVSAPEDDLQRVTLPRYMAAGADLSRVVFVSYEATEGSPEAVDIQAQASELLAAAREYAAALIVLDPIAEHLQADAKNERETRVAFGALLRGCRELSTSLLGIDHSNRMNTQSAYQKAGGSSAKYKLARSVLYVGRQATPDEEQNDTAKRVAMVHAKTNMGATACGVLFEVGSASVDTSAGPVSTGYAKNLGATSLTIEELLSDKGQAMQSDVGQAAAWLRAYLTENGLGMVADEVEKVAKATNPDWTREILKAAAKSLGGNYAPLGRGGARWGYRLPGYRELGEDRKPPDAELTLDLP